MDKYFSPSTGAFYDEAVHGYRLMAEALSEKQLKAGRKPRFLPNPNSSIPADAIAVDRAEWQRLLAAQGEGKSIVIRAGRVEASDPAPPTAAEQLALIRARRDRLLAATDKMVSVPDYPITAEQREELVVWRQALRDFPDAITAELPAENIAWPPRPSWLGENGEIL